MRKPPSGEAGVEPEGRLEAVDERGGALALPRLGQDRGGQPRPTEPPAIWNM